MAQPPLPYVDFETVGPQIGEPFPDVVLPDQNGTPVDLHVARAGKRALVVFYRSASW
jgi:peroxiredoxin